MIAYLDMDGVIANFIKKLLEVHNRLDLLSLYQQERFPTDWFLGGKLGSEDDIWFPVDFDGQAFWEDIEPYPWMQDVLDMVNQYSDEWYICTHARNTVDSYAGKVAWLHKHLGVEFKNIIATKHKHLLAKPDTILLDDNDINCERFRLHGGDAILFPQPWNENNPLIKFRIDHVDYQFRRIAQEKKECLNKTDTQKVNMSLEQS